MTTLRALPPMLVAILLMAMGATMLAAAPANGAYHVVGGEPVEEGDWPSTVALVDAAAEDAVSGQFCAGTAVAADLVLTAAHCFHTGDGAQSRQPEDVLVVAGRTNLADRHGVERLGSELFVHPEFSAANHVQDVAVLRVDGPLEVPTVELASDGDPPPEAGSVGIILGWGRTGPAAEQSSAKTAVLREAAVEVASARECRAAFDPSPDLRVHVCAGGAGTSEEPNPDACSGDSGGPLLVPGPDGSWLQAGITAFGPSECGVAQPGVYALVGAARAFVDAVVAGQDPAVDIQPAPDTEASGPVRIWSGHQPTTAIDQAVASSRAVFADTSAEVAVLTRDDAFPDGLAGSALLFGRGPLLFTPPTGPLASQTRAELQRALRPGATIYLLGGEAAVPAQVVDQLHDDGFTAVRLAGSTREATSVAIAQQVLANHGESSRPPFGTAIVATSGSWPDAVLAGQLSVWWGYPVLLTPTDQLHPTVADALSSMDLDVLIVVGGEAAISSTVAEEAREAGGAAGLVRLAGDSRVRTGLAVAQFHRAQLARLGQPPPDTVVAVNVRQPDGYAHVLSAAPIVAATAGIFVPVEGDAGDVLLPEVEQLLCSAGGQPFGIGGHDVLADDVLQRVAVAVDREDC